MKKFPSIEQFRNVIREVKTHHDYVGKDADGNAEYKHSSPYPIIEFTGTVKLHGTNASIVKYKDRIEFQSRERVLSLQSDNCGFMLAMSNKNLDFLFNGIEFNDYVAVFGEWCGQGVQSGVAISQLPKMFVVFAYCIDDEWQFVCDHRYCRQDDDQKIFHIWNFGVRSMSIDFNNLELNQNDLVALTEGVEQECPVGKCFGVNGVGEGIVWTAKYNDHVYRFKVKGEKHSVSKVKTLASVDVEQINSINEFVESVLTENRLNQGVTWLKENNKSLDQKSTGDYLRWIVGDVLKEEKDTIVENQLDVKKVSSSLSNKARIWWFKFLDEVFAN